MMKKRLGTLLLAGILSINIFGTTTVHAAGDYTDKIFSFYVSSDNPSKETDQYRKYNTSSVYVNLIYSETAYSKAEGYGFINGKWSNETVGSNKYAILPMGQRRVRTNIVEHGGSGTWMKLRFRYYMSHSVYQGEWSPDCAGNYPVAN